MDEDDNKGVLAAKSAKKVEKKVKTLEATAVNLEDEDNSTGVEMTE